MTAISRDIRSAFLCALLLGAMAACGSSETTTGDDVAPSTDIESGADGVAPVDALADDDGTSEDVVAPDVEGPDVPLPPPDDVVDGDAPPPEDAVTPDVTVEDGVTQEDTVDVDVPSPPDSEVDDDDTSMDDTDDADAAPDVIDICADFSPAPYRCADGTLVTACTCTDGEITCVEDPDSLCPSPSCDDGDPLMCRIPVPECPRGTVVAIIDGCYLCVDPDTCEVPVPACESVRGAYCLIAGARECEPGTYLNTQYACDGGDICCSPARDTSCDDGTDPLCDRLVRACNSTEIMAVQSSCERCVNPATCAPWGESTCRTDQDCANDEWCNGCGSSSCPDCDDCVSVCEPARCESDSVLTCRCARPTCPAGATSIVRDGCWVCVNAFTCEPTRGGCGG